MHQRNAASVLAEKAYYILAADTDPEDVHFPRDQSLAGSVQKHLHAGGRAHGIKFERMVVIAESEAGFAALLARAVQSVSQGFESVETAALVRRKIRIHSVLEAQFFATRYRRSELAAVFRHEESGIQ